MPNLNYDPESTDELYLIEDHRVMVFVADQVVSLRRVAYSSSIEVYLLDDEGGDPVLLEEDTDYELGDIDQDATSLALLETEDPFTEELVSDLTIIRAYTENYQISINYVTLEYDPALYTPPGEDGPEPTPALMQTFLNDINLLKSTNSPVLSVTTEILDPVQVLEIDLTGLNEDNHIIEEEHLVTTPNGRCVVRTANGPFYQHDLVILDPNGDPLASGTDYVCVGVDVGRTKATYHTSPVYYCVLITAAITGTVKVSYRAYGGEFTDADGIALRDAVASVIRYLTSNRFLTEEAMGESNLFTDFIDRLGVIENRMDYLWLTGVGGQYASYVISGAGDTDHHWIPFATLYQNLDEELVESGEGIFHIAGVTYMDLDITFQVMFDKNNTDRPFVYKVLYGVNNAEVTDGLDYSAISEQILPKLRIVYGAGDTGMQLQIHLPVRDLSGTAEILVENRSNPLSEWQLFTTTAITHGDYDDNILLPDGATTWTDGDPVVMTLLGYLDGLYVFGGACELIEDNVVVYGPMDSAELPATGVYAVEVGVYDRHTGSFIVSRNHIKPITDGYETVDEFPVETGVLFYIQDLCVVQVSISGDGAGEPVAITVTPFIGSMSLVEDIDDVHLHRFQLNHVKLFHTGE